MRACVRLCSYGVCAYVSVRLCWVIGYVSERVSVRVRERASVLCLCCVIRYVSERLCCVIRYMAVPGADVVITASEVLEWTPSPGE